MGHSDQSGRRGIDAGRRAILLGLGTGGLALGLSACAGTGLDPFGTGDGGPAAGPAPASGDTIGTGSVRIGLILPLTSANGQVAAQSLRNAAEMAINDFGTQGGGGIQILVRDDRGTPEGAQAAAQELMGAGAELLLGPLFGPSVRSASAVARAAGKSVIAFSSDASVASRGVYLLSFLPQADVQRVVGFAGERGKKSFGALVPQNAYGNVVEAEFMQAGNQPGRRVAFVERYQPGNIASLNAAAVKAKANLGQIDTLFLPESAETVASLGQALAAAGIAGSSVQIISTGIWNDPRATSQRFLDGAWFASPDNARFNALAGRYQQQFGQPPTRIATLAYDAVTLAAALNQNFGSQRFAEATLTNPNGFAGQDGIFRFRPTGLCDRGLAVFEIRGGTARAISAAPTSFAARS